MGSQNTALASALTVVMFFALSLDRAHAQTRQYQRPQAQPAAATEGEDQNQEADDSDRLDISDLADRYWAPKDTDFAVVQNRTFPKEKRFSLSVMTGPLLDDTFSTGLSTAFVANYYFSERYGVQLNYIDSNLKDSKAIDSFCQLSGGCVRPDLNRETGYTSIGFNWVPIYAKMSFLNRNILYFDLQVTPHIGVSSYEQQARPETGKNGTSQSAFSYGLDITQYFFMTRNFVLRFDYHNRWYKEEILNWNSGNKVRDSNNNTSHFLLGLTYFF